MSSLSEVVEYIAREAVLQKYVQKINYDPLIKQALQGVKIALERGDDPNMKGEENGSSAINIAASYGCPELVQIFLEHPKTEVNKPNNAGMTALHLAAERGHLDVLQLLLEHPKRDLQATDPLGRNVLHFAVLSECKKTVELVLCHYKIHGISTNEKTNGGATALHLVFLRNKPHVLDVLKLMLNNSDIDPNVRNHRGNTPIMEYINRFSFWRYSPTAENPPPLYGTKHLHTLMELAHCEKIDLDVKDVQGRSLEDSVR